MLYKNASTLISLTMLFSVAVSDVSAQNTAPAPDTFKDTACSVTIRHYLLESFNDKKGKITKDAKRIKRLLDFSREAHLEVFASLNDASSELTYEELKDSLRRYCGFGTPPPPPMTGTQDVIFPS